MAVRMEWSRYWLSLTHVKPVRWRLLPPTDALCRSKEIGYPAPSRVFQRSLAKDLRRGRGEFAQPGVTSGM